MPILYIIRGCSGSGKSFLSSELLGNSCGVCLSTDDYFLDAKTGEYVFDGEKLSDAHAWNIRRCSEAIVSECSPIIIDNTNLEAWEAGPYCRLARAAGYAVEIRDTKTAWRVDAKELAARNRHGVPIDSIRRQIRRISYYSVADALETPKPYRGELKPPTMSFFPVPRVNDPARLRRILGLSAVSFAGNCLLHLLGKATINRLYKSKHGRAPSAADALYLAEVVPSTIHGLFAGLSSFYHMFIARSYSLTAIANYPSSLDYTFSWTVGYSLWDTAVMMRHGDTFAMYAHHIITLAGSLLIMMYREMSYFPLAFGLSELTVVPQNAIFLGSKLGWSAGSTVAASAALTAKNATSNGTGKTSAQTVAAVFRSLCVHRRSSEEILQRRRFVLLLIRLVFFACFRSFLLPIVAKRFFQMMKRERSSFEKVDGMVKRLSLFNVLVLSALNLNWSLQALRSAKKSWKSI